MSHGFERTLERALEAPRNIPAGDLAGMLVCAAPAFEAALFAAAREVKARCCKTEVLPRALIEVSNVCAKDCLYCGIRKSMPQRVRYRLREEEVLSSVADAVRRGYTAVAFQAGEIESEANTAFYERILRKLDPAIEVTLSLGEQTEEVYARWKEAAGGRTLRYLIRIETSNRELYGRIHPPTCSFERRLECIRSLRRLGYVTGSGVMIGLPGQTVRGLAADIAFFGREHLDMIGMGPYIPVPDTPLAASTSKLPNIDPLSLSLRMIALARLYLHDVNIVSATALEALDSRCGRERGIAAGANVIMPNLTPPAYVSDYALYPGKTPGASLRHTVAIL